MTTYITNIGLLATPRGDSARRGRQQGGACFKLAVALS